MEQLDVDPESKHDGKITGTNSLNNSISMAVKSVVAEASNEEAAASLLPL